MKTKDIIADFAGKTEVPDFAPTRAAGFARLDLFAERSTTAAAITIWGHSSAQMSRYYRRGSGTV